MAQRRFGFSYADAVKNADWTTSYHSSIEENTTSSPLVADEHDVSKPCKLSDTQDSTSRIHLDVKLPPEINLVIIQVSLEDPTTYFQTITARNMNTLHTIAATMDILPTQLNTIKRQWLQTRLGSLLSRIQEDSVDKQLRNHRDRFYGIFRNIYLLSIEAGKGNPQHDEALEWTTLMSEWLLRMLGRINSMMYSQRQGLGIPGFGDLLAPVRKYGTYAVRGEEYLKSRGGGFDDGLALTELYESSALQYGGPWWVRRQHLLADSSHE